MSKISNLINDNSLNFDISVVIGSTNIKIGDVLKLGRGAVVKFDKQSEDFVEIHANNKLIALGEIIITENEQIGISVVEIIK